MWNNKLSDACEKADSVQKCRKNMCVCTLRSNTNRLLLMFLGWLLTGATRRATFYRDIKYFEIFSWNADLCFKSKTPSSKLYITCHLKSSEHLLFPWFGSGLNHIRMVRSLPDGAGVGVTNCNIKDFFNRWISYFQFYWDFGPIRHKSVITKVASLKVII